MENNTFTERANLYIADLKKLARSGQSAALGLEDTALIDLPIVTDEVDAEAAPELKADTFVAVLGHTIRDRLSGKDQEKAEVLFGYGEYAGLPMQDRYDRVAKIHFGKGGTWERFRKEPLDDLLLTILTALHREAVSRNAKRRKAGDREATNHGMSAKRRPPMVGGDFALNRYDVTYNFPQKPGDPREFLEIRELRATTDGLEKWQMGSQYWGKSPDQAPDITLFGPGTLEMVRDEKHGQAPSPGRAYVTRVTFPRPLVKNETVRFGLVKRQPVEFEDLVRPGHRDQRDVTPVVPIEHLQIAVRFPADHRPSTIWHFEDLPDYLSPGVPDESNILAPDELGYVVFAWDDLRQGLAYGIAWRW